MTWNYRLCKHPDGHYSLNEVYYNDDGTPYAMTESAVGFVADEDEGPDEVIGGLEMALKDAKERPLFEVPKEWKDSDAGGEVEKRDEQDEEDQEALREMIEEMQAHSRKMFETIEIGTEFHTSSGVWRCTDKGTRTIIAIKLDSEDKSLYSGPPYMVMEYVHDEHDLEDAALSKDCWVQKFCKD
uniref:Uncharacterized protein n=1 Tax=Magnetococcus massalia (strain MO-1) TaxID=451514 RepID=A0A1S7LGC7_MAGMO|nr:protein of unknown function [Candidatus Magnetococcus massalia]